MLTHTHVHSIAHNICGPNRGSVRDQRRPHRPCASVHLSVCVRVQKIPTDKHTERPSKVPGKFGENMHVHNMCGDAFAAKVRVSLSMCETHTYTHTHTRLCDGRDKTAGAAALGWGETDRRLLTCASSPTSPENIACSRMCAEWTVRACGSARRVFGSGISLTADGRKRAHAQRRVPKVKRWLPLASLEHVFGTAGSGG